MVRDLWFLDTLVRVRVAWSEGTEQVKDYSRKIAAEMLAMPGFIDWTGASSGTGS